MYELLTSTVIEWKQLWRTIWFPTINCPIQDSTFQLPSGTYRLNVCIDGTTYQGIGPRFTEQRLFEVFLLDTSQDFYGKEVMLIPLVKIRDNKSFTSLETLKHQLEQDLMWAKEHPQIVITFWTFDHFHPWHAFYLRQARQYGDYLITVIARDATVKQIKWAFPDHSEDERMLTLTELDYIDIVELGNTTDPYTCLREYTPNVICLWYDQHSFDIWLREWCNNHWLTNTTIIRIDSFYPEQRKSSLIKSTK